MTMALILLWTVGSGGALIAVLHLWTKHVTIPHGEARLDARTYALAEDARRDGWTVWRSPQPVPAGASWAGPVTDPPRLRDAHPRLALESQRSGYAVTAVYRISTNQEGEDSFTTECVVHLPAPHRASMSVKPRLFARLADRVTRRDRRPIDWADRAEFERRFLVDAHPWWAADHLLTSDLRAAILRGWAAGRWTLDARRLSSVADEWLPTPEVVTLASNLVAVAKRLPTPRNAERREMPPTS